MRKFRISPSIARLVLGTAISVACLWLALRGVHLDKSLEALRQSDMLALLLALLTVGLSILVKMLRWRLLFVPRSRLPRMTAMLQSLLVGQFLNVALPLRVGDLARAYYLGEWESESKSYTLGTIAIEKIMDTWMLILLTIGLVPFVAFPDWFRDSETGLVVLGIIFLVLTICFARGRRIVLSGVTRVLVLVPARLRPRFFQSASLALESLSALQRWDVLIWVWVWSIVSWLIGALTNFLVFRALGLTLPFTVAVFVLIVLQAGIAVPSSPGKLGVFQYLCILALGVFGVDRDLAFSYSWALYFVVIVPISLSGGLVLWWRNLDWQSLLKRVET